MTAAADLLPEPLADPLTADHRLLDRRNWYIFHLRLPRLLRRMMCTLPSHITSFPCEDNLEKGALFRVHPLFYYTAGILSILTSPPEPESILHLSCHLLPPCRLNLNNPCIFHLSLLHQQHPCRMIRILPYIHLLSSHGRGKN